MISNTSDIPLLAGGNINVAMVKKSNTSGARRTKIICTLGPACWAVEQLEALVEGGMNVARFNFSHGSHEGHKECLDRLRQAAKNMNQNVGELSYLICFRMQRILYLDDDILISNTNWLFV